MMTLYKLLESSKELELPEDVESAAISAGMANLTTGMCIDVAVASANLVWARKTKEVSYEKYRANAEYLLRCYRHKELSKVHTITRWYMVALNTQGAEVFNLKGVDPDDYMAWLETSPELEYVEYCTKTKMWKNSNNPTGTLS